MNNPTTLTGHSLPGVTSDSVTRHEKLASERLLPFGSSFETKLLTLVVFAPRLLPRDKSRRGEAVRYPDAAHRQPPFWCELPFGFGCFFNLSNDQVSSRNLAEAACRWSKLKSWLDTAIRN